MDNSDTHTNQTPQEDVNDSAKSSEDTNTEEPNTNTDNGADNDSQMSDATGMLELEQAIKTFHKGIASKRAELKKFRETIKDTLENDATYAEHTEKVKEAKQIQKKTKDQLLSVSSIVSMKEDMKELRADIRDLKGQLSNRLIQYYETTDQENITMDDGDTYVIKTSAKLVKQK